MGELKELLREQQKMLNELLAVRSEFEEFREAKAAKESSNSDGA